VTGSCTAGASWNISGSEDATFAYTCEPVDGSCAHTGTLQCVATATDPCGNTATTNMHESWDDKEPPTIECPDDASVHDPAVNDNCDNDITAVYDAVTIDGGDCYSCYVSTTLHTWDATDACGNPATQCTLHTEDPILVPPEITDPADEHVSCPSDASDPLSVLPNATAWGQLTVTVVPLPPVTNHNSCGYVQLRKWKATDCCSNTAFAYQTVTVSDDTPPTWEPPSDVTIDCTETNPPVPDVVVQATCREQNIQGYRVPAGDMLVDTWNYNDGCHSLSHSRTIYVQDTTPPTITVQDEADPCAYVPTDATSDDDCGESTCTVSESTAPDNFCGQWERTWTCVDSSGNQATAAQTVTASDDTPPTLSNPPPSETNYQCESTIPVVKYHDNCDETEKEASYTQDSLNENVTVVTWAVQDTCGNGASTQQTITVQDTTPPVISGSFPPHHGECTRPVFSDISYSDNCLVYSIDQTEESSESCTHAGTASVMYTVVDSAGNVASASQTVTWSDEHPPIVGGTFPLPEVTTDVGGHVNYDPTSQVEAVSSDNCATPNVTCEVKLVTDTECKKVYSWGCTVEDECENSVKIPHVLTVTEIVSVSVVLTPKPEDESYACDEWSPESATAPSVSYTLTPAIANANVTFHSNSLTLEGGNDDCYKHVRWWSVEYCGSSDDHQQTIDVQDKDSPDITVVIEPNPQCAPENATSASATDGCGGAVPVTLVDIVESPEGTFKYTYEAEDHCNNPAFLTKVQKVEDTEPPEITPPMELNITIDCGNGETVPGQYFVPRQAQDNCVATLDYTENVEETCPCNKVTVRTWTAVDGVHTTTEVQTITSYDTTPPVFNFVPPNITVEDSLFPDGAYTYPDGTVDKVYPGPPVTATDASGGLVSVVYTETTTQDNPPDSRPMTITRTYEATDECGNAATMVQIIHVFQLSCSLEDEFVPCDPNSDAVESSYTQNSDVAALLCKCLYPNDESATCKIDTSYFTMPGSCDDEYKILRTFSGEDIEAVLDIQSLTQTVHVTDTEPPQFQINFTVPVATHTSGTTCGPQNYAPSATDQCDDNPSVDATVTGSPDQGSGPGSYSVEYAATDRCGNTKTTVIYETVEDYEPPFFVDFDAQDSTEECVDVDPPTVTCDDHCGSCTVQLNEDDNGATCPKEHYWTWTATDTSGNSQTSTTVTITVDDTTPPLVTAGIDKDCYCDTICAPSANAWDDCDGTILVTSTQSSAPGVNNTSVTTWTHTATDACGNIGSAQQIFTYYTNHPPTITAPPDYESTCSDVGTDEPTVSDDCESPSVSMTSETFSGTDCPVDGILQTIHRVWVVSDSAGNVATASQTVTIKDVEAPELYGLPSLTYQEFECNPPSYTVTTSDDCSFSPDLTMENTAVDEYTTATTWIATDDCGRTASGVYTIRVQDTTPPTFSGEPEHKTVYCEDLPDSVAPTATDYCGDVTIEYTHAGSDGCYSAVSYRTWTATDTSGNAHSYTQTVTSLPTPGNSGVQCNSVADQEEPCDGDFLETPPQCTDLCGNVVTDVTHSDSDVPSCGDTVHKIRTWVATDICGNSETVVQELKTVDTVDPYFVDFPEDSQDECTPGTPVDPTFQDLCGSASMVKANPTVVGDENCEYAGYVLTKYTITDECGNKDENTHKASYSDDIPPTYTTNATDVTIECDEDVPWPAVDVEDNCHISIVINNNYSSFPAVTPGSRETSIEIRTWESVDTCGNAASMTQTITKEDTTPPQFHGSFDDVNVECPGTQVLLATAFDNCDVDPQVNEYNFTIESCGNTYQKVFVFVATDHVGNTQSVSRTVTSIDTTAPTLAFSGSIEDVHLEDCDTPPVVSCTANDLCGTATCVFQSAPGDSTSCGSSQINTWTGTDTCGNAIIETQTVTWADTTPPQITSSVADVTFDCLESGHVPSGVNVDDCNEVSESPVLVETTHPCEGTTVEVWEITVSDVCGNTDSTRTTVTYQDTEKPTISVNGVPDQLDCTAAKSDITADTEDNCGSVSLDSTLVEGGDTCSATRTHTFTAYDDCGNGPVIETVVYEYTDTTPPTFIVTPPQPDTTIEAGSVFPMPVVSEWTDDCSTVTSSFETFTSGDACRHTQIRVWSAEDACGHGDSFAQTITVIENRAPELSNVPGDVTVECGDTSWRQLANEPYATSRTGEFLPVTPEITGGVSSDCSCQGEYIITFTAQDECDLQVQESMTITIVDTTPPTFLCEAGDYDLLCDQQITNKTYKGIDASWNSSMEATTNTVFVPGTCDSEFHWINTYSLEDCSGNTNVKVQTITVTDSKPPTLTDYPVDTTAECSCDAALSTPDIQALDNCGEADLSTFEEKIDQTNPYTYKLTRSWTATDGCGNTASHGQTVTVSDNTPPIISGCPEDEVIPCELVTSATTTAPALDVMDNCDASPELKLVEETVGGSCDEEYTIYRTWTATDASGNSATETQTVGVVDNGVPTLVGADSSTCLSPPNEKYYQADVLDMFRPYDNCGGTVDVVVLRCNSTEISINDAGQDFLGDCKLDSDGTTISIKAKRDASGEKDRKYVIMAKLTDSCGHESTFAHTVTVPMIEDAVGCVSATHDAAKL